MDIMYKFIYRFGIWPVVIFIGVIAPVYEELVFRLWGNGKKWTGYTSIALMALFSASVGWWLMPVVLAAGIVVMLVFRTDRTKRLFAMMLLSSLAFALMHIGNYDPSVGLPLFIVAVIHKFGMGLVASYLVINHNILWSIGLHILNNGVMAIMFGVGFNMVANETTTIETDSYRITMKPVLTQNQLPDTYTCGWENDSVYTDISCLSYAAQSMAVMANNSDTSSSGVVKSNWKEHPLVQIRVEMLGGSRDWNSAVRAMEKEGWISIDTVGDTLTINNTYDPLLSL